MRRSLLSGTISGFSVAALAAGGFVMCGPATAVSKAEDPQQISTAASSFLGAFGTNDGWRVDRHPRLLGDVNRDGREDIVGFANDGVWVSYGQANGTVSAPAKKVNAFGYSAGGWRVDLHPRELADVNGDGRQDIVGFASDGVWVSYGQAGNTFSAPAKKVNAFGTNDGWRVDRHPRLLGDVNRDGREDIVGFANDGVWVSYGQANGTVSAPAKKVNAFGYSAGGWRVDLHPRELADVNGDGRQDIVGFASDGVWVSYGQAGNTFSAPAKVVSAFGYDQNWRVDQHPRLLGDIDGNGKDDIVGFGIAGTYINTF
ncbi:FG-GAP repeat domain-containing protein [Kocuria nitroreducens]|uniref:FG-GAP repeat domain-containing protein n=1 Tax=Kocuria nitroreducens TaxID=3058914 RepID=UPI0036DAABD2